MVSFILWNKYAIHASSCQMITHKIIVFKYNQKVFYSSYKDLANDRGDNIHQAASPFSVLGALLPSICTIITLSCLSKLSPVSNPFHNGLPPHSTSIPLPFPFRGLIIVYHCERLIMRFSYTFCIKWINNDGDDNDDDDNDDMMIQVGSFTMEARTQLTTHLPTRYILYDYRLWRLPKPC